MNVGSVQPTRRADGFVISLGHEKYVEEVCFVGCVTDIAGVTNVALPLHLQHGLPALDCYDHVADHQHEEKAKVQNHYPWKILEASLHQADSFLIRRLEPSIPRLLDRCLRQRSRLVRPQLRERPAGRDRCHLPFGGSR